MTVQLISHTLQPEKVIAASAKLCYSDTGASDLMDGLTDEKASDFVDMLSSIGHESPIEHACFTFAIEGVSRSLLAQITRHRIASFSVQSQRYVRQTNFQYITPPEIQSDNVANAIYENTMAFCLDSYNALATMLEEKHYSALIDQGINEKEAHRHAEKMAIEDARFVLPNASETKIVMTMNARELIHFFRLRCCNRAQWEIRALAKRMLEIIYEECPTLFKNAGPACLYGICPEGKMCCGKQKQVKEEYKFLTE